MRITAVALLIFGCRGDPSPDEVAIPEGRFCVSSDDPGAPVLRRLNRTELDNTLRDLTGVDTAVGSTFPEDGGGLGFDTVGSGLTVSPLLVEKLERAIWEVLDRLVLEEGGAFEASIESFGRRAWRRTLSSEETEQIAGIADAALRDGAPRSEALRTAYAAILLSPSFYFRMELDRELTPFQLATRISYFLRRTTPDDELLDLAESGDLSNDAVLEAQIDRMLADPRSATLTSDFGAQWLHLDELDGVSPDPRQFPLFDGALRSSMRSETDAFLSYLFQNDRPLSELILADYSFTDERLRAHYGDSERGGLLRHASILALTSHPDRTSPVLRGKWVLETLLCAPPPAPPMNVPALTEEEAASAGSVRNRLERHRQDPSCASCHARMDPIGFGLERYDAIGAWRALDDEGYALDTSSVLPDGTTFDGPVELANVLASGNELRPCIADRLATYALGRKMAATDRCFLRMLAEESSGFRDLTKRLILSDRFRRRSAPAEEN